MREQVFSCFIIFTNFWTQFVLRLGQHRTAGQNMIVFIQYPKYLKKLQHVCTSFHFPVQYNILDREHGAFYMWNSVKKALCESFKLEVWILKGVFSDSSNLFLWHNRYKQNKLIFKISVDYNLVFMSYVRLCVLYCSIDYRVV